MSRLKDKVAIVTGAAHGIGRAIAELFAEHAAHVVVVDIDTDAGQHVVSQIHESGGSAEFVQADVASQQQIERAVQIATGESGRVDVLVNNVAHLADWLDVEQATADEWDRGFRLTLMSAANFICAVVPRMTSQKSGCIINIASIHGLRGGRSSAVYTSMKHALVGLTRSAACDFGPQGVRVNAICPGAIRTRISPPEGSELLQRQIAKTMLGRTGQAREVAWAALFLACDESSYITGVTLPVDGGWSAF